MDIPCPFCGALKWPQEKINCCAYGDIQLNVSHDVPPEIAAIIYSPHVLKNIRVYNMALSMASVGHQNKSLPDGMFVLGGRTYHRVGSMLPQGNAPPAFAQIYVLDVEEATDRRLEIFGRAELNLAKDIITLFKNVDGGRWSGNFHLLRIGGQLRIQITADSWRMWDQVVSAVSYLQLLIRLHLKQQ